MKNRNVKPGKEYLSTTQIVTIQKFLNYIQEENIELLSNEEIEALQDLLNDFTKPSNNKK